MFRKSMIVLATVASLGAASMVPAAAAGWGSGPAAGGKPQGSVQMVHDTHGGRDAHRDNGRNGGRTERAVRHDHQAAPRQVCSIKKVRVVERTRYGKTVRIVPQKECHFVGPRWH